MVSSSHVLYLCGAESANDKHKEALERSVHIANSVERETVEQVDMPK